MTSDDTSALIVSARAEVDAAIGPADSVTDRPTALRSAATLAGRIDHTLLAPDATAERIEALCVQAREHGFASVCVNSRWVPLAAACLRGSDVMVCSVVGFPLGAMAVEAKAFEAGVAVSSGADEIDMVMDIGSMLSGDLEAVLADMRAVIRASAGRPVKVIIEACLLDDRQKVLACLLAVRSGAAYVKTSTGFSVGGATLHDVALMRAVVGDALGVKASGGIRDRATAVAMIDAGADRIGASASIAIAAEE